MATPEASLNGRKRRISSALRTRLEEDVQEIRAQLENLATKDDIEDVKRHIDARTADILEAIKWPKPPSVAE